VEVRPAQRGEKRRLQELAQQNAELALEHDTAQTERKRLRRIEALEELRESLNLESLPLRIECFDISNIQDQAPVGSMVVFQDALPAMQAYDLPRVAVISLAKREEEVFVPGRPDPIVLDSASPGLQLLQRIRDEAHRFALGFHRQRRESRAHESILDALPGVGPARRRALIRHFGSPERILAAAPEEFEGVPGVPAKTGRRIYAALHKAGRA